MKAVAVSLAALSLLTSALAQVTLNTPSNPVVCQPLQLTWTGGQAPYFISVQDGNNPSGPALFQFPEQNGTSLTWEVNFQAGTSIGFLLRDNNGATSQTASVQVQPGISTACVGQTASVSGGGSAPQPTGTGAGSTPASGGSTPTNGSTPSSGSTPAATSPRPSTTGTSPPASTSNAASATGAQIGAAGILGAALLALLA